MLDEYFLAHDDKVCLTSDRTLSSLSTPRMDQEVNSYSCQNFKYDFTCIDFTIINFAIQAKFASWTGTLSNFIFYCFLSAQLL